MREPLLPRRRTMKTTPNGQHVGKCNPPLDVWKPVEVGEGFTFFLPSLATAPALLFQYCNKAFSGNFVVQQFPSLDELPLFSGILYTLLLVLKMFFVSVYLFFFTLTK